MSHERRLAALERRLPPAQVAGKDCQSCPPWAYRLADQPPPICPACGRPVAALDTFADLAAALAWLREQYRGGNL